MAARSTYNIELKFSFKDNQVVNKWLGQPELWEVYNGKEYSRWRPALITIGGNNVSPLLSLDR